MKRLAAILGLLLCFSGAFAGEKYRLVSTSIDPASDSVVFAKMRRRMASVRYRCGRPTVAVVFSGGGAKGAAHVGVLRRLEEKGIPVDMVLGTSMGGLVGGLYSLGYSPAFLDSLLRSCDWELLLSDDIDQKYIPYETKMRKARYNLLVPVGYKKTDAGGRSLARSVPSGWVSGINVENTIAKLSVGYRDSLSFADLPIPFFCVSSDLVSGKSKNWTSGDVALAMRSTMSIPGLFNPVSHDGMVLVDGGIRNNFPTDLARAMGADIVIGVMLSQVVKSEIKVENIGNIISRLIDMLSREAYDKSIEEADVCIHPDLHEYNMLSFNSEAIDTIISRGYAAALACDDVLGVVASRTAGRPRTAKKAPARDISTSEVLITSVEFPGKGAADSQYLGEMAGIKPGDKVSSSRIEEAVSAIFGTGSFKDVSYSLLADGDDGWRLVFKLTDGPVHRMGLSGRIDTEDMVAALMEFSLNAYRLSGSRLDLEARIGQNWYAQARYSKLVTNLPSVNLSLRSGKNMANMIIGRTFCDAGFWHHRADAYLSGYRRSNFDMTAGLRFDYYGLNSWLSEMTMDDRVHNINSMSVYRKAFATIYGNARAYTLDDKYFPNRGFSLGVGYEWVTGNDLSQIIAIDYREPFRLGRFLTLVPSLYMRYVVSESTTLDDNLFLANFAGGAIAGRYFDQQMPFDGFHRCVMLDDFAFNIQMDLRARVYENAYVSVKGGVIHSAPEIMQLFGEQSSLIGGGALEFAYATPAGPIKFDLQYSSLNGIGAYLSLGYDF